MSISDSNNTKTGSNNTGAAEQQTPPSNQNKTVLQLGQLGPSLNVLVSRQGIGDDLGRLNKTMRLALENIGIETNKEVTVEFVSSDVNQNPSLGISVLSVVTYYGNTPYYFSLLLENTAAPMRTRTENVAMGLGAGPIELINVPSMYNTKVLRTAIASQIKPKNNKQPTYAGSVLVKRQLDLGDVGSVTALLKHALLANDASYRETAAGAGDLDFSQVQASTLQTSVQYGQPEIFDVDGNPLRSDLVIALSMQIQGSAEGQIPVVAELTKCRAFIDVVVGPAPGQPNQNPLLAQMNPVFAYTPSVILTQAQCNSLSTRSSALLAAVTSLAVVKDYGWTNYYKPRSMGLNAKKAAIDLRDIGAIGYEVNNDGTGKFSAYNTKTADFDDQQLMRILANHFRPDPTIAIDVQRCGPSSHILASFVGAVNNPAGTEAKLWEAAANKLTGGNFGRIWKQLTNGQTEAFGTVVGTTFVGYYEDADGKKSLDQIDHIAYLNLTKDTTGKSGELYMSTVLLTQENVNSRLFRRRNLLKRVLGDENVVINDLSDRIVFNPKFLSALLQGIKACNISIVQEAQTTMAMQGRGVANYLATSAIGQDQALFTPYNGAL